MCNKNCHNLCQIFFENIKMRRLLERNCDREMWGGARPTSCQYHRANNTLFSSSFKLEAFKGNDDFKQKCPGILQTTHYSRPRLLSPICAICRFQQNKHLPFQICWAYKIFALKINRMITDVLMLVQISSEGRYGLNMGDCVTSPVHKMAWWLLSQGGANLLRRQFW